MFTFNEVFSFEHLLQCGRECLKGVRWKQSTQMFEMHFLLWISLLYTELHNGTYKSKGFTNFEIYERGKHRNISSVHISERCVQKCLCRYALRPLIIPKLIYDNGATIPKKGTDFCLNRLKEHLRYHVARYKREGGILTLDYHNYFGSINHNILLNKLNEIIEDKKIFNLIAYFVYCFPGNVGLGLGSEISQICAVFYPNQVDHYMKDKLKIHGYGRYMDDVYIISNDLNKLREYRDVFIEESRKLGLEINERRIQITKFKNGTFVFLKKRIFISSTGKIIFRLIPKSITNRRRKIKKQKVLVRNKKMNENSKIQSFNSWVGHAKKYNCFNTIKNMRKYN